MCLSRHLFRSTITGEQLWEAYLSGFGEDPVYRDPSSSVHNCKLCNNFIRRYGNLIAFDNDFNMMTLWDLTGIDSEYAGSVKSMSDLLKTGSVQDVFVETWEWLNQSNFEKTKKTQSKFLLGLPSNVKVYSKEEALKYPASGISEGDLVTFEHFAVSLPKAYVDYSGSSRESLMAGNRLSH